MEEEGSASTPTSSDDDEAIDYEGPASKRKKRMNHQDKSVESNQSELEDNKNGQEEWMKNVARGKFIQCGDCSFKSSCSQVVSHVKRAHPSSTTALPPALTIKRSVLFQCLDCDYSTKIHTNFRNHERTHQKKSAHKCSYCSFSSDTWTLVVRHAKRYHSNAPTPGDNTHEEDNRSKSSSSSSISQAKDGPHGNRGRYLRDHLENHIKAIHPLSKVAPLLPTPRRLKQVIHKCKLCLYENPYQQCFERHKLHHREKFTYRCHLCSFSERGFGLLDRHVREHHWHPQEDPSTSNANSGDKVVKKKLYPFFECSECEYTTTQSGNFKVHREGHTRDEKYKCSQCSFSSAHKHFVTLHKNRYHRKEISEKTVQEGASEVNDEKSKSHPDGRKAKKDLNKKRLLQRSLRRYTANHSGHMERQKYKCTCCPFASHYRGIVDAHVKRYHSKVEECISEFTPSAREEDSRDFETSEEDPFNDDRQAAKVSIAHKINCLLCHFSTQFAAHMIAHEHAHKSDGKFKCSLCSFSSDLETIINLHLEECHTPKERKVIAASATARTSSHQSNASKSQGTLPRFFDSPTKSSSDEEIEEEATPFDEQPVRNHTDQKAKLLSLQNRIQVMKKKVQVAQKELEETTAKKIRVWDEIAEINQRKLVAEFDLRVQQCEVIKIKLAAMKNEVGHNDVVMAKYTAIGLEDEMKAFDDELRSLKEQNSILEEEVEECEVSMMGANQVLQALMSELDSLKQNI